MTSQDLLTFLCQKHKVPRPYTKTVDYPHWDKDGDVGGYYVPRVHILCIVKGTADPDLALCHEFHHYLDELKGDLLQRLEKRLDCEKGVQKRAVRDLAEYKKLLT